MNNDEINYIFKKYAYGYVNNHDEQNTSYSILLKDNDKLLEELQELNYTIKIESKDNLFIHYLVDF
jgi:hypothetical protein